MSRKTSNIWSHFIPIENTTFAKCKICKKKYSFKTSVTNLKTHYSTSHWIEISTANQVSFFHNFKLKYSKYKVGILY